MTLTKLESYKGWTITRINDKIVWYNGECYYQNIAADNLETLFNLIDEIENKKKKKETRIKRKKK